MKLSFLVNHKHLRKAAERAPVIALAAQKPSGFAALAEESLHYLKACNEEWRGNYEKSSRIMKDITGFTDRDMGREFLVYVVHPNIRTGCDNIRVRGWNYEIECPEEGPRELRKNYATIQLWHRILHSYLPKGDVSHAAIELATDNYLRQMLRGGGYIPRHHGREELNELRKDLWNHWNSYLGLKKKDIRLFCDRMKKLKAEK